MSFEVEGILYRKFDTESKTETFQARDFVLKVDDGKYSQLIKFQLTQDRCQLIDPYPEGEQMKVHFDLRGREWNGRFFTNLNAWKLENIGESDTETGDEDSDDFSASAAEADQSGELDDLEDELPF